MPQSDLSGKTVLITGGARRIGRAIALALAEAGADVAITYRDSKPHADQTVSAIAELGRRGLATSCDVRSETSVRNAVAEVSAAFGRLDILVNNAAVFEKVPLDTNALEDWDRVFETNTRGPFLVARESLVALRANHGRIVNIGSLGGEHAWASHAHYSSAKAALHMLTKNMAKAFAPEISVNCVAPGWIELEDRTESESLSASRFAARTPMGKNGTAEDVAQTVLFFATGPKFITGQILTVDGGLGLT
jgi:NAD(P)-dependent dehydrogenase (short-subunit alcohol dehydrogenase family)